MKKILSIFSCLGVAASVVSYSPSALALEPSEIYAEAEKFTVQIDGAEPGTGTIIANDNGIYTVLTCRHVMDTEGSYQITTVDGSTHQVAKIENIPDVDLAIITFSSNNTYPVTKLGDSATAKPGEEIYVVGYNAPFPGAIEREYLTESAEVQGRREASKNGYQIIHSATVTPGSSGGGIFDNEARLIGVNGEVFSEANTGKAYGNGIPLEIYLATPNSLEVPRNVSASEDFLSAGNDKNERQDYRGAIADYDEAIRLDPNNAVAYNGRGVSYFKLKDYQSATADFNEAIRLAPNDAVAYTNRGDSYNNLGDYQSAIANFDEAIRLDPEYVYAYNGRGNSYYGLGDYQSAIADYNEAIRLDPKLALVYQIRGRSYFELKDYQSAIVDFDEAIRLDPNNAGTYVSSGLSYHQLKHYQNAIAEYDKAIRVDPQFPQAYFARGLSYKAIYSFRLAKRNFEQAAELYQRQGDTKSYLSAINEIKKLRYLVLPNQ